MNNLFSSNQAGFVFSLLGAGVLAACGGGSGLNYPPDAGTGGATSSSDASTGDVTSTVASTSTGTGGSGGSGGSGGTGGATPGMLSVVTDFDITKQQIPEGIALNTAEDTAYIGLALTGQIVKVNLADGKVSDFGSVPAPMGKGLTLGLAFDKTGALFVGVATLDPTNGYQPGIYKLPAAGGAATLFAKDVGLNFPNGLVFDATGNLFVTDSTSGSIFEIDTAGKATKWATDPLMVGDKMSKCAAGLGFDFGANGLGLSTKDKAFYVANTDKGSIVKIPIKGDGTAGTPAIFAAADCATLGGADGLSIDTDGTLLVALNGLNTIARVGLDGKVSVVVAKDKLDSPASTWITSKGKKTLYVTNSAIGSFFSMMGTPKPALLKLPLGG